MTYEAVLIYETEIPIPFTCADGTGIEKGCILKIADPATVSAALAKDDYCGGIAAKEKIANNGKTKIAVYRGGIFRVLASGSITAGQTVSTALGAVGNSVLASTVADTGSKVLGIALETAALGETFLMELNIGATASAYS